MKKQEQQLIKLYLDYIQAFSRYDIEATTKCYQLPCVMSTPEKVIVLSDTQAFIKEFDAIFTMLRDNNIDGFKASNASYQQIDGNTFIVKIDWQFFENANNLFTEFSAIYHLSYQQEVFKIINVISHDMCQVAELEHPLNFSAQEH